MLSLKKPNNHIAQNLARLFKQLENSAKNLEGGIIFYDALLVSEHV